MNKKEAIHLPQKNKKKPTQNKAKQTNKQNPENKSVKLKTSIIQKSAVVQQLDWDFPDWTEQRTQESCL